MPTALEAMEITSDPNVGHPMVTVISSPDVANRALTATENTAESKAQEQQIIINLEIVNNVISRFMFDIVVAYNNAINSSTLDGRAFDTFLAAQFNSIKKVFTDLSSEKQQVLTKCNTGYLNNGYSFLPFLDGFLTKSFDKSFMENFLSTALNIYHNKVNILIPLKDAPPTTTAPTTVVAVETTEESKNEMDEVVRATPVTTPYYETDRIYNLRAEEIGSLSPDEQNLWRIHQNQRSSYGGKRSAGRLISKKKLKQKQMSWINSRRNR